MFSGLSISHGKWDFKVSINKDDLKKLSISKPMETSHESSVAMKDMIESYLKEKWIEPEVLPHAVNMFPVPKHDGSYRYVYNYVPVNKLCDIAQNQIPNLRNQFNELTKHKFIICLDLRSAYNQIRI